MDTKPDIGIEFFHNGEFTIWGFLLLMIIGIVVTCCLGCIQQCEAPNSNKNEKDAAGSANKETQTEKSTSINVMLAGEVIPLTNRLINGRQQ